LSKVAWCISKFISFILIAATALLQNDTFAFQTHKDLILKDTKYFLRFQCFSRLF